MIEIESLQELSKTRTVSWAQGAPLFQNVAMSEGISVRILENERQGIVTSRIVVPEHNPKLIEDARNMARFAPPDPIRSFAKPASMYPTKPTIDSSLFSTPMGKIEEDFSSLEKEVLALDPRIKKVIRFNYSENHISRSLQNNHKLNLKDESSSVSFIVEILAEEKTQTEVAWDFQSQRFAKDLDMKSIAIESAQSAVHALGGRQIPSGKYAVLFSPRVGTQLLHLVTEALSAEAVQRGRSFFRDQLHKPVAASCVTLIDDPLLPNGVRSASFDDEGTPHETMTVVNGGILEDYFFDLYSATKATRTSNGHGIKASLGALPRPAATNFYMKQGKTSPDEMLKSSKQVFLLRDVMGLHMADLITGEFSLGASGILYENGKFKQAVRGVTIAGQLGSILKDVSAVGSDLTWYGATGAPSFLLPQVTIAGN